jgi:hypothetical protein
MKAGSKLFGSMFLGLWASIGCACLVHAQGVWVPITAGMDLVSTGPVINQGDNFSFDFEIENDTGVICPQLLTPVATTAILGALAPGDYTLITTSWYVPVGTNYFTVPTNPTPTLQPIGFGPDGSFNIQLTGVANVNYILQRSTNLVSWTTLSSNSVGMLSDTSPLLPGPCYYRVQILQLVSIH